MMDDDERKAIEALGWQTINTYGYTHPTGWTIGIYCLNGTWESILWDGKLVHARLASPLAAAKCHADFIRIATAQD